MQCIENLLPQKSSMLFETETQAETEPEMEENFLERRCSTIFEQDPEQWIRNNIVGRNMILKVQFFGRLGLGQKTMTSISKENMRRMSKTHIREAKQIEEQDEKETSIKEIEEDELEMDRCYSNIQGDFAINFFKKTDEEMRNRYINRLINMKIMKVEPTKKHQTMLIFDWDDTILCTNFLANFHFVDIPKEALATLEPLDDSASRLLLKAHDYGKIFIITNAAEGWVQSSGKLFLPKTYKVIMEKDIQVISARSGYEDMFPGDSKRWKVEAFLGIEHLFDKNIITNLVCVGDSHIEIDAAHILAQKFSQAIIKTIKLREKSKPDELTKQQSLICEKMEQIYLSAKNLTIRLERKAKEDGSEA